MLTEMNPDFAVDPPAVAAEVERLKSPDLGSGQPPWPTIGYRIQEETRQQNEWIVANLSREQRRGLSRNGTFGILHAYQFWDSEPPLSVDTWDELLTQCAEKIVLRRKETGCPTFRVYTTQRSASEHKWPPVRIHAYSNSAQLESLFAGASALNDFAATVAQISADVRTAATLLNKAQATPALLEDPAFLNRWKSALDRVDDHASDFRDDQSSMAYKALDNLFLASGHRRLITGSDYTGEDSTPIPVDVERIREAIAKHGIAADSMPL